MAFTWIFVLENERPEPFTWIFVLKNEWRGQNNWIFVLKNEWRGQNTWRIVLFYEWRGHDICTILWVLRPGLAWLKRPGLAILTSRAWVHLNDVGPCPKGHVLSQSISMMSCNVTVKLGRIHKDSDGSERRVCIRVCICICVCILYTAGCEVLMRSLQENSNFAVGTLVRVCIWVCICMARQSVNEWMSERVNEWMDELINGWMDGWRDA